MTSVLQDWVTNLPLREQGTLLTAIRGCDLAPKMPLDSIERQITAYVRWAVMNPADAREVDSEPGCFMQSHLTVDWKASELGHYPLHYVMHLMHSCEVIGYRHPDSDTCWNFFLIYDKIVKSLHLTRESRDGMIDRLSEDRIAKGEIVS